MKTWRRGAALSALGVLLTVSVGVPALGAATNPGQAKAQQQQIGKQISQLREQASQASAQEAELLGRLDEINNRTAEIDGRVAALQAQIDAVQAELDAATARLVELQAQEAQARAELEAARNALAASTERMQEQATDAYVGMGTDQVLAEFMFKADDMRNASAAGEYLRQVVEDKRSVVEQHRELEGRANDLAQQIERSRVEAEAARNLIAQRQGELAGQKAELDALRAQAQADADAKNALLAEIEAKKGEILAQIYALQRESDNIAALLRSIGTGGQATPPPGRGVIANPVPGARLSSNFGMRVNPVTGVYTLHAGQDYAASTGTPIRAGAAGTVVTASYVGGYGNYTCVNHGGGLATCYAHQSQMMVTPGQKVGRNQVIGLVGNTGNSTGPHLHFEVRVNGTPVNPLGYL